jgi:hypothetical protein
LIGEKGVFFHAFVQAIRFKMPMKTLNSFQNIVRQKTVFLQQAICSQFSKTWKFHANCTVRHLLENCQSKNKNLCKQIAGTLQTIGLSGNYELPSMYIKVKF